MTVNQFKRFATGPGANILTPAAYAALTTLLAQGYQAGTADSTQMNTTWRQAGYVAASIAQIITNSGRDALDDNDQATFIARLLAALSDLMEPRLPAGALMYWGGPPPTVPVGQWIEPSGQVVAQAGTYANLFGVLGTTYNTGGEGAGNFRLPNYRGTFQRVQDAGRGLDPSRAFGPAFQTDMIEAHKHTLPMAGDTSCVNRLLYGSEDLSPTLIATLDNKSANVTDAPLTSAGGAPGGGTETRPVNMVVRVFMAY